MATSPPKSRAQREAGAPSAGRSKDAQGWFSWLVPATVLLSLVLFGVAIRGAWVDAEQRSVALHYLGESLRTPTEPGSTEYTAIQALLVPQSPPPPTRPFAAILGQTLCSDDDEKKFDTSHQHTSGDERSGARFSAWELKLGGSSLHFSAGSPVKDTDRAFFRSVGCSINKQIAAIEGLVGGPPTQDGTSVPACYFINGRNQIVYVSNRLIDFAAMPEPMFFSTRSYYVSAMAQTRKEAAWTLPYLDRLHHGPVRTVSTRVDDGDIVLACDVTISSSERSTINNQLTTMSAVLNVSLKDGKELPGTVREKLKHASAPIVPENGTIFAAVGDDRYACFSPAAARTPVMRRLVLPTAIPMIALFACCVLLFRRRSKLLQMAFLPGIAYLETDLLGKVRLSESLLKGLAPKKNDELVGIFEANNRAIVSAFFEDVRRDPHKPRVISRSMKLASQPLHVLITLAYEPVHRLLPESLSAVRVHVRDVSIIRQHETERIQATVGHADNFPRVHLDHVLVQLRSAEYQRTQILYPVAQQLSDLSSATTRFYLDRVRASRIMVAKRVFVLLDFMKEEEGYCRLLGQDCLDDVELRMEMRLNRDAAERMVKASFDLRDFDGSAQTTGDSLMLRLALREAILNACRRGASPPRITMGWIGDRRKSRTGPRKIKIAVTNEVAAPDNETHELLRKIAKNRLDKPQEALGLDQMLMLGGETSGDGWEVSFSVDPQSGGRVSMFTVNFQMQLVQDAE